MKNYSFSFAYRGVTVMLLTVFFISLSFAQNTTKTTTLTSKDSLLQNKNKKAASTREVLHIALTGTTDASTIKGNTTNLIIYNTATAGVSPNNVTPGFYHNTGTTEKPHWQKIEAKLTEAVKNTQ